MTNIWPEYSSKLAGGWKCISFEMFDNNKKLIAKPHGENPLGRVLLSKNGYLSAHVARPDRMGPLPSGKPWQTGEDNEVAHVARGMSVRLSSSLRLIYDVLMHRSDVLRLPRTLRR